MLQDTIETLAAYERGPTSEGERRAAEWLRDRFEELGCEAEVEEERAYPTFASSMAALSAIGLAGGLAALAGRRRLAAAAGAFAAAAIADDAQGGAKLFRKATLKQQPTWNVVAHAGDREAPKTLVLLAHHDAAPTGFVFDPTLQRKLAARFPGIVERMDTALPLWWPVVGGPALVAGGALKRRRGAVLTGMVLAAGSAASFADIARNRIVPGANDNLTGVAVLVELARTLREDPVDGLHVMLVSCGSEEVLQGGIRGFGKRWFPRLPRESTYFLNLDTVGSPRLIMLEGEGETVMEDYFDRSFRDLVARAADRAEIPLRRGMRARASTDSVVPHRARYPTATLASMDEFKALSNYHQMTDVPENLVYETVDDALRLCEAVARELPRRR